MFPRDVHVGIERVRLEHHRDVARLGRCARHVPVADADGAAGDRLQARDHPQRRRFPAAGRTDDDHELALADVERELRDHPRWPPYALLDVVDLYSRQGDLPESARTTVAAKRQCPDASAKFQTNMAIRVGRYGSRLPRPPSPGRKSGPSIGSTHLELPKSCRLSAGAFMNDCRGDACVARIVASIHDCLPGDACVAPTTFRTRQRGGSPPWQAFKGNELRTHR